MRNIFIILLFCSLSLYAKEQVTVIADSFEADEFKKVSYFKGSVHIKKGSDEIKADNLMIVFGEDNKPIKYEAKGAVSFKVKTESQNFEGLSNQIIYEPLTKKYIASGDVNMVETIKNQILKGERISIDRISGKSKISGSKNKPVKFIFTVDE